MEKNSRARIDTLFRFFASRKLAITLLTILIGLSVLGTVIPQESLCPRDDFQRWQSEYPFLSKLAIWLDLPRLFTSLVYIAVIGMLCLSIIVCTYRRAQGIFKTTKRELFTAEVLRRYKNFYVLNYRHSVDESLTIIRSKLKRKGYRFSKFNKAGDVALWAEKGRYGAWGSLLFHCSFLVILVGALASTWTRFEGKIVLTEGQTFQGHPHEYLLISRGPLFTHKPLDFQLSLQEFKPLYDTVPKYVSEVLTRADNGESHYKTIRAFHALSHKGYTFYQKDHGFSPSFVLKDSTGRVFFDSFVAFMSDLSGDEVAYVDAFEIPGTGFTVEGQLYPDAVINDGKIKTKSPVPNNPVAQVRIMRQGREVHQGIINLNQSIKLGDFYFSFNKLRYWSSFRVVKDAGLPIIYAGFFLGILGLLIRIVFIRQHIRVVIEGNSAGSTITLAGKAERNRTLFAEKFGRLVENIQEV